MIDERRAGPTVRARVHDWRRGDLRARQDRVVTEEPLEVRLAWPGAPAHAVAVTMRTPGADFELAAGFVVGEGIAAPDDDVDTVAYCTDPAIDAAQTYNVTTVTLHGPPRRDPSVRHVAGTSACGVCGKDSIAAVRDFGGEPVRSGAGVAPAVLAGLPEALRAEQRLFARTGGLHAAGLFGTDGDLLLAREDVGRHNAVDKVVGAVALGTIGALPAPEHRVLCTSARAGFEIVQKAVMARIPVVAAVGAASSMAVDCAREFGVTLVGFTRGERFVVYAGADRLRR